MAIYFDPTEPARFATLVTLLLALYAGYSLTVLWRIHRASNISAHRHRRAARRRPRVGVGADVLQSGPGEPVLPVLSLLCCWQRLIDGALARR
ncbi:MAG: hypothetical protein MZV64_13980 [Ignavibacteriales bacterium]|nr:hypothetical protein [Ignavibacteriales bacterium]